MIRRKSDTFNNYLAIPGGFVDYGEAVEDAAIREAKEEINVDINLKAILGVYSAPGRDPRGPVISTVFIASFSGEIKAGDDASDYEWLDLNKIDNEKLAFDHKKILHDYIKWKTSGETFWSSKL